MGSGKTEAAKYLESRGFLYISADKIVDELYEKNGEGYKKLHNFFGEEFFYKNGQINKKKLAKFVFSDVNKLRILNGLIHPIVVRIIRKRINKSDYKNIVVEAVYLEIDNLLTEIDKTIWVECEEKVICERLDQDGRFDVGLSSQILKIQKELEIKPKKIDYILDNNGSLKGLYRQIDRILDVQTAVE